MSLANSKKTGLPQHQGFEWAGTVARLRRGGASTRSGRRSALLGMLTATYANANRTGRTPAADSTSRTAGTPATDRA